MHLYLIRVYMDEILALSRTMQLGILYFNGAQVVTEVTQVEGVEFTFLLSIQGP